MKPTVLFEAKLFVIMAVVILFTTCNDSIQLTDVDEKTYKTSTDALAYIIDDKGRRGSTLVEFRNEATIKIFLALSKNANTDATATFTYNPTVLQTYNETNKTNYELFPRELVTLKANIKLLNGVKKSNKAEVKIKTGNSLKADKTYVIPLSAKLNSANIKMSTKESNYLIFVKDLTKTPDVKKVSGIEIISIWEVNDSNPLNALTLTLKNSKKYLIDHVVLFAANINYHTGEKRVYVSTNPKIRYLLSHREKFLKPLQDRGMKVILGVLGNWDHSGISNLSDETARRFAQELKAVCNSYKLDGVFFDDEYSSYQSPPPPGFVEPSNAAAARLFYETKKAMPDRLTMAYDWPRTDWLPDVEGQQSGTFVDYGIRNYGGCCDLSLNYPGMPKSRMALFSQEFARGYFARASDLEYLRKNKYGAHMIFAISPYRWTWRRQLQALKLIAEKLFDDELVYNGNPYPKEFNK